MTRSAPRRHDGPGPDAARVYDAIRTAHLERFAVMEPAWVFYGDARYDFDESVTPDRVRLRRLGRLGTLRELLRARLRAVEVNEPLMTTRWIDLALQIAVVRVSARVRRSKVRIGAYCIGVVDPAEVVHVHRHVPAPIARWWSRLVLRSLMSGIDRLAIGTPATWDLMSGLVGAGVMQRRGRMFAAVPQPCSCPGHGRDSREVLFVGALVDRKGVPQLMRAWEATDVSAQLRLRIIGTGELASKVEEWAARRNDVTVSIDPPRELIHAAYRRAHVLVLLSQRVGLWREQVGLPIVEGLAHGCEIVTTSETGLALWLSEHGHTVVAPDTDAVLVASSIAAAASAVRSPDSVLASLPDEDPRVTADRWMLGLR